MDQAPEEGCSCLGLGLPGCQGSLAEAGAAVFIVVGVCYRPPKQEEEVDEVPSSDNWKKAHISQKDQMVEVGRDIWRSSGPISLLK